MDTRKLKEYRNRWEAVATVGREEQQQASFDLRWRQLNSLFGMAAALGLANATEPGEIARVRHRWNRLKDLCFSHPKGQRF